MHRKYRPRHYADRLAKARTLMPHAAIGADVMTGFPGETDALFEESRQFIESMPYTYLHVFTYSERPGTPAAEMPDAVPVRVRKDRNRILRDLAASKNAAFREAMLGREVSAVTIEPPDSRSPTTTSKRNSICPTPRTASCVCAPVPSLNKACQLPSSPKSEA